MRARRLLTRRRETERALGAESPEDAALTGANVSLVARPCHMSLCITDATTSSSTDSETSLRRTASTI